MTHIMSKFGGFHRRHEACSSLSTVFKIALFTTGIEDFAKVNFFQYYSRAPSSMLRKDGVAVAT